MVVGLHPDPQGIALAHRLGHHGHHAADRGSDEADEGVEPQRALGVQVRGDHAAEGLVGPGEVLAEDHVEALEVAGFPAAFEAEGEVGRDSRQYAGADGGADHVCVDDLGRDGAGVAPIHGADSLDVGL